jgi:hypothetical protein
MGSLAPAPRRQNEELRRECKSQNKPSNAKPSAPPVSLIHKKPDCGISLADAQRGSKRPQSAGTLTGTIIVTPCRWPVRLLVSQNRRISTAREREPCTPHRYRTSPRQFSSLSQSCQGSHGHRLTLNASSIAGQFVRRRSNMRCRSALAKWSENSSQRSLQR